MIYGAMVKTLESAGFEVDIDYHSCISFLEQKGYRVNFCHYRYESVKRHEVLGGVDMVIHSQFIPKLPRQMPSPRFARYYRRQGIQNDFTPYPKGGLTQEFITQWNTGSETWSPIAVGESVCVLHDNFCYKTGRKYALLNAMSSLDRKDI